MPDARPRIDRYEIIEGLGRGAMGSVYLALDTKMGRQVAVKVLQKELVDSPKHRQRFEREARSIATLHHPNIVDLYDFGETSDGHVFLVMELVRGPHVGHLVRTFGPMPESVLCCVGYELARALSAAHAAGIIHRDLKPENVFLDDGRLVLGDFGIVKAISATNPFGIEAAAPNTDIIGTPGFMAPEQLEKLPLDERTDIFAFGSLLYYLATQELAFAGDSPYALLEAFRETRPAGLHERRADISAELSELVQSCLQLDPELRPATCEALRERLRDTLGMLGVRDTRDVLRSYQLDPQGFVEEHKERVVTHLLDQMKLAVDAKDGSSASALQRKLAVFDADEKSTEITGVRKLLARHRAEQQIDTLTQSMAIPQPRRRRALLLLALLAGGGAAWWGLGAARRHMLDATEPVQDLAILNVESNEPTHVFVDGRALGSTPNFAPAVVRAGQAHLEFTSAKRGKLRRSITLTAEQPTRVFVDWQRKAVRVVGAGASQE